MYLLLNFELMEFLYMSVTETIYSQDVIFLGFSPVSEDTLNILHDHSVSSITTDMLFYLLGTVSPI